MAKGLSKSIEDMVQSMGAPKSLVGVIIAAVVLLPECVAAIRAARNNKNTIEFKFSFRISFGKYWLNDSCDFCSKYSV